MIFETDSEEESPQTRTDWTMVAIGENFRVQDKTPNDKEEEKITCPCDDWEYDGKDRVCTNCHKILE